MKFLYSNVRILLCFHMFQSQAGCLITWAKHACLISSDKLSMSPNHWAENVGCSRIRRIKGKRSFLLKKRFGTHAWKIMVFVGLTMISILRSDMACDIVSFDAELSWLPCWRIVVVGEHLGCCQLDLSWNKILRIHMGLCWMRMFSGGICSRRIEDYCSRFQFSLSHQRCSLSGILVFSF